MFWARETKPRKPRRRVSGRPARRPGAPKVVASRLPASSDDEEFRHLIELARDKSSEGRGHLVDILGDLFFGGSKTLNSRERDLMTEILRKLVHEVEKEVRRRLAGRLADKTEAPRDLVMTLATDEIEVAHPVLMHSEVLRDLELVEIVQHQTMEHQLAIAARRGLSEDVTDALIKAGEAEVVTAVLENLDAQISSSTLEALVNESKQIEAYQAPLVRRTELPPRLARKMYWWVSAALREYIAKNFEIDSADLDSSIVGTVTEMIGEDETRAAAREAAGKESGPEEREITPDMMVTALRRGNVAMFEALFAKKVGLRKQLIKRFIFESGGEGLAIAAKAAGINKADFASIFLLSRAARPGEKTVAANELSKAIAFFNQLKTEVAQRVVTRWHLDPDYLHALRDIETGNI